MINLKYALRTLLRTPFVTLIAILSLSLGIGANSAIFSLFNQMLLRPLPVQEPAQLVNLSAPGPKPGSQSCNQAGDCDEVFSYPMFRDLERVQTVFTGIAAHRLFSANLAARGQTLNGDGVLVSGSYFPLLGLHPSLGRLLGPEDDRSIGEAHVVVLTHAYWQHRFALGDLRVPRRAGNRGTQENSGKGKRPGDAPTAAGAAGRPVTGLTVVATAAADELLTSFRRV